MSILKHNLSNTSKLFELLQKEPPLWWNKIKYDPRLYIEIRKNNSINV